MAHFDFDWRTRPPHALGLDRKHYYRFLRIVYDMTATEAWEAAKRCLPPSVGDIQRAIGIQDDR